MKKGFKKVAAIVLSAAMALGLVVTGGGSNGPKEVFAAEAPEAPAIQDSSSQVNYSTILGRGVDFGIIAEHFQQRMHMQTPYAVEYFSRSCGEFSTIDLIPNGSTAQIMVGHIDKENSSVGPSYIRIDGDVAGTMNMEATAEVFEGGNHPENGNTYFQTSAKVVRTINPATPQNIKYIYENVFEKSSIIEGKINSSYGINYRDYYNAGTLDLTKGDFVNKVVYIQVDNDLLKDIYRNV